MFLMQIKHNIYFTRTGRYLWTSRLSLQLYIYTQQTGMLKAMATTDTFFTIGRVMLLITLHLATAYQYIGSLQK